MYKIMVGENYSSILTEILTLPFVMVLDVGAAEAAATETVAFASEADCVVVEPPVEEDSSAATNAGGFMIPF